MWINGNPSPELAPKLQLVHQLIEKSLDVMPMIPVTLRKQIRLEFPYYKQPNFKIVAYIHNLLQVLDYCPSMIHDVLELILENLLMIDVSVTREQIERSEEFDEELPQEVTDEMKLPVAETLDMCMEKMFEYFRVQLQNNSETSRTHQKEMTDAIFNYFDQQIMKTYTKHVHFLLFYIASVRVS